MDKADKLRHSALTAMKDALTARVSYLQGAVDAIPDQEADNEELMRIARKAKAALSEVERQLRAMRLERLRQSLLEIKDTLNT